MRTEKKYRDLFRVETVESGKGTKKRIIYTGDYYKSDIPQEQAKKYKMCLILISAIMAVLFFYMGLLNNDGSRVFYVVLPYVLQFLPIAYTVMSSVSLYPKDILTVVQYEKSYVRIKASGTWILILSIAGSIGDIIYIFGKYGNKIELELTFLICNFAMAILAIIILRIHNRIKFKIITRDG